MTSAEKRLIKQREYNKRYRANRSKEAREKQRENHYRYIQAKRRDPAYRAAEAAYMRLFRAMMRSDTVGYAPIGNSIKRLLSQNEIYAAASNAVPNRYAPHNRDDIISDIVLAVIENKLTINDIPKQAKSFIAAYWKQRDLFGTLSLDAPISGMGGLTYLDRLAGEV